MKGIHNKNWAGKTPSEMVIECLDDFSASEPKDLIIVFSNDEGELIWATNLSETRAIGLLECAKHWILKQNEE